MVRPATLEDIQQLTALFDAYRIFYRKQTDIVAADKFLRERIEQKESVIFVDEVNAILTGFTQLYPLFSSTRMRRSWLLNDLFVLPVYRGLGISKKLIEAAKQLSNETGASGILLETEKSNTTGNRLYPSTGFQIYDDTNFYWWENK